MNTQFVSKHQRGGILKIILVITGILALLLIVAVVGAGWYTKTKIDEAGGLQAVANKLLTVGVEALKPELEKALSAEDAQRFQTALITLKQKATSLTEEQTLELSATVRTMVAKAQSGSLTEADAKLFVDELTRILETPVPSTPPSLP